MDFLNNKDMFEVVLELPRELTNGEILGRRFFTDFKKRFPSIDTIGEPSDWSSYSIRMWPLVISFATLPLLNSVHYVYNRNTNILTLFFNQNAVPIEVRTFTQHILNEAKKCQNKKKKK
jgi:hypothetical protein